VRPGAWGLRLGAWIMFNFPFMILKEPH